LKEKENPIFAKPMGDQIGDIVLTSAYLGPVEYFTWLAQADQVLLENDEHYTKQTYRNRCRILTANGMLDLVIPVIKVNGNHTKIRDVKISYSEKWQLNHWRAIQAAYSHAPYFLYYSDALFPFYRKKTDTLFELNLQMIEVINDLLGIKPAIRFTENYRTSYDKTIDLRETIHPKKKSSLTFTEYTQVFSDRMKFMPNLSIIDLLFNQGPEAKDYLQNMELPVD
jgi:hypothetical protein